MSIRIIVVMMLAVSLFACEQQIEPQQEMQKADLILTNAKIYTYQWPDPDKDGKPAAQAPYKGGQWSPDAEALAIKDGKIAFVGSTQAVEVYKDEGTQVINLKGATVLPGMVDAHAHVEGIGRNLEQVDLSSAQNEEQAVALIAQQAEKTPKGEWVIAHGWDEGLWANRYPDMKLLSEKAPDHPVFANSLHGFAAWGNRLAFEKAGITAATEAPVGGEILKDAEGKPSGILMNNATDVVPGAIPEPTVEIFKRRVLAGLDEMARSGYVAVHLAGVRYTLMRALEELERENKLKLRVYAMISATDDKLVAERLKTGPDKDINSMLVTRSVKAYYDGALGSRGAKLIDDYADRPGHRGVGGLDYGFYEDVVGDLMRAGFQVGIHAIGDGGNRETLDFFAKIFEQSPELQQNRHRIEHAQIIHPDDFDRFVRMELIASMQPPHAVEDKVWAEDRLGAVRLVGAYAWRTLRLKGVPLAFGSDLTGSDHNVFYGLHSTISRRSKDLQPPKGWLAHEALTIEEAIRGYSTWPAYAAFMEQETGALALGKWADITVMDIDPHTLKNSEDLFSGTILMTVVAGNIVYQSTR